MKVLLNSFHLNGQTLRLRSQIWKFKQHTLRLNSWCPAGLYQTPLSISSGFNFRLILKQELMYIWNGFKVLNHRPDLVQPLMKLVENSLHKLKQTKGKWFTRFVVLLHKLLPPNNPANDFLRRNFALPLCKTDRCKKSFIFSHVFSA